MDDRRSWYTVLQMAVVRMMEMISDDHPEVASAGVVSFAPKVGLRDAAYDLDGVEDPGDDELRDIVRNVGYTAGTVTSVCRGTLSKEEGQVSFTAASAPDEASVAIEDPEGLISEAIAVHDPEAFGAIAEQAKAALAQGS